MIHFLMLDANVARGLQFPHVTIGSDNLGLGAGPEEAPAGKPHPPAARVLREGPGHLRPRARCAQLGRRDPQDDRPGGRAARAPDRGVLRPGAVADVVVFVLRTVDALATYQAPRRNPAGIRWDWVNGGAVLEAGRFRARPTGRVLAPAR